MSAFPRWSQIARKPGAVQIIGYHPIEVPALGQVPPYNEPRPGIRLLVQPLEGDDLPWTIDITSTKVIASLDGFLRSGNHIGLRFAWRLAGFGVHRRDTLHFRPMNQG